MPFTAESVDKNLLHTGYPMKSCIDSMAEKVDEELKDPVLATKYPFKYVEWCNVRSPQLLGQKPITFANEVLGLCQNPALLEKHSDSFSPEVVKRAKEMLNSTGGSGLGAYTVSQGISLVRKDVVQYITRRDSLPEGYLEERDIYLSEGAAAGVKLCLQMFLDAKNPKSTGYLVPSPQYNIYREFLHSMGSLGITYELNEEEGWNIDLEELEKAYEKATTSGVSIRGIIVINPGNPTGGLLTESRIRDIINFSVSKDIAIYADEVLQTTVSSEENKFVSFQRVVYEIEQESKGKGNNEIKPQLISFNSMSKGNIAYGGVRAGYFILHNFDEQVRAVFTKMVSINLCPNTTGQIFVSLALRGPTKGTEDESLYLKEKNDNLLALRKGAEIAYERLNKAKGVTCQPIKGGIYAFPRITIPQKAVEEAERLGLTPSEFYCESLLNKTGIAVEPGSFFIRNAKKHYVRMSIISDVEHFISVLDRFTHFNDNWLAQYEK